MRPSEWAERHHGECLRRAKGDVVYEVQGTATKYLGGFMRTVIVMRKQKDGSLVMMNFQAAKKLVPAY